jgi:ribose transport system ATP-binding protein
MSATALAEASTGPSPPLLEVDEVSKRYGATNALVDASFQVSAGEVLAVLGQNGAGKSTLVKILAGVVRPTSGTVRLDGEVQHLHNASQALGRGIVLIPQELAYVRDLTVAENILLGHWGTANGIVRRRQMEAAATPFAAQVGMQASLRRRMSQLSLAECQLVEIAKALSRRARVLLLDEPTAALSDAEALSLFRVLEHLRARSVAMLFISHRLDEVLRRTDRILILRDGRVVACRSTRGATRKELIEGMLGHEAPSSEPGPRPVASAKSAGESVVSLHGASHKGPGLRAVDLDVRAGEILSVFGVAGSGHEALALTLAGLRPPDEGEVRIDGRAHAPLRSARQARRAGVMYVPPERKTQGLILSQSVLRNMTFPQLRRFSRMLVMRPSAEEAVLATAAERLRLKYASSQQPIAQLSGGNQQKILLASRIYARPRVLVVQEPSRGVDVAARDEIHQLLREVAREGTAIVVATADVEEAVALGDRLAVMRDGRVAATFEAEEKTLAHALEAAGRIETEG